MLFCLHTVEMMFLSMMLVEIQRLYHLYITLSMLCLLFFDAIIVFEIQKRMRRNSRRLSFVLTQHMLLRVVQNLVYAAIGAEGVQLGTVNHFWTFTAPKPRCDDSDLTGQANLALVFVFVNSLFRLGARRFGIMTDPVQATDLEEAAQPQQPESVRRLSWGSDGALVPQDSDGAPQ